jgi:hypothetical protein
MMKIVSWNCHYGLDGEKADKIMQTYSDVDIVPAVYDVLAARIRALRSKDQGGQNVAEKNRTKALSADCGFS